MKSSSSRSGAGGKSPESMMIGLGFAAVVLVVVLVTLAMDLLNFDVVVGILTVLTLTLVSVPALRYVARAEKDPGLFPLLMYALAAKVVFTLVRYFFITVVYHDNGDAGVYSGAGAILMDLYRQGIFTLEPPGLGNRGAETARIAVVVACIYMVTGVSRYAGSFVFSWLCFTGQVLMFRAFNRGVPEGDSRRYATLVLFLPSMLFWPSSIGKEALMVFCIGLVSFGAAQLLSAKVRIEGMVTVAFGAAGLFFIRPHMALIAITAMGFAFAVSTVVGFKGEIDKKASSRAFALRMVALVLLIGGASLATTQLSAVLGDGTGGAEGLSGALQRTKAQTAEGGSKFDAIAVQSPTQIPAATVTVLFRPFPWESGSLNGVIASAEGVLLAALVFTGRRRILNWAKHLGKRPYLVYALAFAFTFIIAFSYIGNFGILARQRTQMIPLALTVLGMPAAPRLRQSWFGARSRKPRDEAPSERTIAPPVDSLDPALQSIAVSGPSGPLPRGESR